MTASLWYRYLTPHPAPLEVTLYGCPRYGLPALGGEGRRRREEGRGESRDDGMVDKGGEGRGEGRGREGERGRRVSMCFCKNVDLKKKVLWSCPNGIIDLRMFESLLHLSV